MKNLLAVLCLLASVVAAAAQSIGGGSPSGVSLTQLPIPSNVIARWTAGQGTGVTTNGASISAWNDIVGGVPCSQATGANQPQLATNRVNGLPSINFNGSFYCQLSTSGVVPTALASKNYAIFIAARMLGGSTNSFSCIVCAATSLNNIYISEDGIQNGQAFGVVPVPFPDQMGFHTIGLSILDLTAVLGSNYQTQYLLQGGSVSGSTSGFPISAGGNALTFGAQSNGTFKCTCEIFEIVIWNSGLTPPQWKQAQMWADDLYGQPYPWAQVPYTHTFFGDSIMLGLGATNTSGTPPYLVAQQLGLKNGQWDNIGVSGITLTQLNTLASTWVNPLPSQTRKPSLVTAFEFYNVGGAAFATSLTNARTLLTTLKSADGIYTNWGTSTSSSVQDPSANRVGYDAGFDFATINATGSTYNNGTGAVSLNLTFPVSVSAGKVINIIGATGTGGFASINGPQIVTAVTVGSSTVTFTIASGLGATTITGGSVDGVNQTNIDSYCPIHKDAVIGVPGAGALYGLLADGIHLTSAGNQVLANDFAGCIRQFLGQYNYQSTTRPGNIGQPSYTSGQWVNLDCDPAPPQAGAATNTANIYLTPFCVRTPLTIKGLAVDIPVTVGSTTCRVVMYDTVSATNLAPGYLRASTAATADTGMGPLSANILQGTNNGAGGSGYLSLPGISLLMPGVYWAGAQCGDSTAILQATNSTYLAQSIGAATAAAAFPAASALISGYDYANTYASGPPVSLITTAPTATFKTTDGLGPDVRFQVQ